MFAVTFVTKSKILCPNERIEGPTTVSICLITSSHENQPTSAQKLSYQGQFLQGTEVDTEYLEIYATMAASNHLLHTSALQIVDLRLDHLITPRRLAPPSLAPSSCCFQIKCIERNITACVVRMRDEKSQQ